MCPPDYDATPHWVAVRISHIEGVKRIEHRGDVAEGDERRVIPPRG